MGIRTTIENSSSRPNFEEVRTTAILEENKGWKT